MPHPRTRPPTPPPRYLGRSQQLRLLMLVMSLGVILLAIEAAAKPENWYWLWGGRPPTDETGGTNGSVTTDAAPLAGLVDEPLREQLARVKDDRPFRAGEHEVFYELLARLDEIGSEAIIDADIANVSFVQLQAQPAEYRGKWVRFRGTVRRLKAIPASANAHGIELLHQLWIQHDDDPRTVSVVYCTQLPANFAGAPTGQNDLVEIDDIRARVAITGISLKRWPYHAQDGMRTAPLVLAVSPDWRPVPQTPAATNRPALPSPAMMAVALVSAVVIAVLIIRRGSRRTPPIPRTDQDAQAVVVRGMQDADTNLDNVAAIRQRDKTRDED